ncbi:MAG: tetraacyldisaccharide 4'-kinase [Terracidiphilus sp.]|jgi:tetraacyldisaccharide 4'-kinase
MRRRWLAPLTPLYAAGLALRNRRIENGSEPVRRLRFPVVSIGNLSTGGSGKTPLTIALAQALAKRGLHVDVLSRGYGRKSKLTARVNPDGTAEDYGDEPLLIARETGLPVYVAPQRYDAGLLAETDVQSISEQNHQPIVHLLDDGFQHRQLYRDVDILLLNRQDLTGHLLPAGNLREPLSALRRATVLAVPADEAEVEQYLRKIIPIDQGTEQPRCVDPVWRLRRTMEIPAVSDPVAAFCGIARPEQFFAGLEAAGLRIAARTAFPDHHRYTARDLDRLITAARAAGATMLLTTEKDLVRLGSLASAFPESLPLKTARLRVEIEDQKAAIDWLINRLGL